MGTRVPLSDATSRANTTSVPQSAARTKYAYAQYDNVAPASVGATYAFSPSVTASSPAHAPSINATPPAMETPTRDYEGESKRNSAASQNTPDRHYSSCDGFPNKKSHIGPWQLGKTLGKGSSARVRAARHCVTQQDVAVKIIAKKTARMTQSGSIAILDQVDSSLPENIDGVRRMPLAIEREVAILKLIEHPNIVKLYDIWENRNEIYLIMEFVENGDLFTYINCNGALTEESSLFVFRQMMNAVQYCHTYNICHRDLKPENILLKADGQIKIADFGMAALHQGPRYHLQTSCGSPHYAAPELLKARPYRGEKADIWSMGVILFVMLAGRLPFDESDLGYMLAKAKKGIYTMPAHFSPEAKDLVHRILQVEPEVRISMNEMWQHPLVWKYGYLDEFGSHRADGRGAGNRGTHMRPLDLTTIDTQIFRQLHSMWHTLREDELAGKLVSNEPNDQKMFYWLLFGYRDRQMENFNPTLTHSMSDYHHANQVFSKKVSTRQFSQGKVSGHKRSVSRFTVISNIAETETETEYGTIRSYDPYKSSSVMRFDDARAASHAKIVIHRSNSDAEAEARSAVQAEAQRARAGSANKKRMTAHHRRGTSTNLKLSRGSTNSVRSLHSIKSVGRYGATVVRPATRYRRGVNFSQVRKPSGHDRQSSISSISDIKYRDDTLLWNEDLTEFSCKIARDLDEAFMSSLLTVDIAENEDGRNSPYSLRLSSPDVEHSLSTQALLADSDPSPILETTGPGHWDSRPLPPSPPLSDSVRLEIMQAEADRAHRKYSADSGPTMRPLSTPGNAAIASPRPKVEASAFPAPLVISERRVVSAPVYPNGGSDLPSIYEGFHENGCRNETDKPRAVSAPSKNQGLNDLAMAEKTIRVVVSPTAPRNRRSIATPQPLDVSKNSSRVNAKTPSSEQSIRQQYIDGEGYRSRYHNEFPERQPTIVEEGSKESLSSGSGSGPIKMPWLFRRQSKLESRRAETPAASVVNPPQALPRKRSLFFPFWKSSRSSTKLSVLETDDENKANSWETVKSWKPKSTEDLKSKKRFSRLTLPSGWYDEDEEERGSRKIDPQQNWLARIFHVKPAKRHLCLSISQRRARQETVSLLREWKNFGIRDIEVDKVNNIVFARVAANNYLGIREVSFACEIITVIEHRKSNHLCIIRLTQERGSANSFHKVADTIKSKFRERHLLVADTRKSKMMVKTLNS
ncbi:serine/threonine-protein kinase [Grosmannia clavigera kw1407]|uniref:non-specific serine/threonine protein kinase n=1 Tax=Grosmannia clavigera (strain kw1407 / UAMH 11150) TaxID=655863 RepID=F0XTB9_GROCL|nr:serine/threonine-protein kinase [Grosmannia clavigera kw1407]EFW99101.1 serine/threonine-protein kinase [Grosmannia clavigera kw1407]